MTALPRRPKLITITMMAAVAVLSLNMIVPAFGEMAEGFGVSYAEISFLFSGYLIITGFLTLLAGPLSDRFGRRPIALFGISVFAVASAVCAVTPNLTVLFTARIIQTVVVGSAVISQAVVRDTSKDQADATKRLASVAIVIGLAPLIGPTAGGVVADLFGWRGVFWAQTLVALVALVLVWFDLEETNQHKSSTFFAQIRDYPTVIASPRYWGYAGTLCLGVSTFFAFLAGMPLIGKSEFQFNPTQIGMVLGTLTVGYILANIILRQITAHFWDSSIIVFGRLLGLGGAVTTLIFYYLGLTSPLFIIAPLALLGAANGFSVQPSHAGVISINPRLAGSAAGLGGAMVYWIGAGASALMSYLLSETPSLQFFIWLLVGATVLGLMPALFILGLDKRAQRGKAQEPPQSSP